MWQDWIAAAAGVWWLIRLGVILWAIRTSSALPADDGKETTGFLVRLRGQPD